MAAHSASTFLIFEDSSGECLQWSYAEFDTVCRGIEFILKQSGVRRGSAVHIVLRNCPAFVALWIAISRLGATAVFADPGLKARDLASQIRRTNPVLAVCGRQAFAEYQQAMAHARISGADVSPSHPVIAADEDSADILPGGGLYGTNAEGVGPLPDSPQPHDRLAVMFTSGTTSEPKGVVLTQCNYAHVGRAMAQAAGLMSKHRWLVTLPLFHANAQYYCFAPAIAVGASVALTSRFSASAWPHQAQRHGATHASLFAAPIRMILARRRLDAPKLELTHVWFAQSLGRNQFNEFGELVGTVPRQLYGMTETIAVVCAEGPDAPQPDRIGDPRKMRRVVRIAEPETNRQVLPGDPGMILVQGRPGCDLFQEYLSNPAASAAALVDLDGQTWLRTGDLARTDQTGRLRFVGRVDDVIKVSGENVSLTELEASLAQVPGVLEVAVVPRPDPIRDVIPVAYVVPRDSAAPPSTVDLTRWANENLPPQARPRDWHIIDELPRTSVGKIRRSRLIEDLENPYCS
ncbi:class I adenylate-forming enzyme family protein [Mycolicibacterium porcinum]|uniref:class I adenylate-forming enzyme family protein n=1 Tax=Mycolicibacterium porcinum TaxID=39693 RepID=UPI00256EFBEA|nr:AMP-binding protein [Mycolicibacterium porcinum]